MSRGRGARLSMVIGLALAALLPITMATTEAQQTLSFNGSPIDPQGIVLINYAGRCSGSMVTPTTFITAAHCVPAIGPEVTVGAESINQWGTPVGGSAHSVDSYLIPDEYQGLQRGNWEWDLAVVKISPAYEGEIKPFPTSAPAEPWLSGWSGAWGNTGNGLALSPVAAKYRAWEQVEPGMFQPPSRRFVGWGIKQAFGENNSEVCEGDSGAGLVVDGGIIGQAVAGFPPCGEFLDLPSYFVDYTNEQYRTWIGKAVSELDPASYNPNFGSCEITEFQQDGLRHVQLHGCIDGSETTAREDGVVVTIRDQYYGAFWLRVSAPAAGLCKFWDVDGFGEIIESGDC